MKNPFTDLQKMLGTMEDDFQKFFEKSNNAAGTRVRKGMKDLRDKAQEIRMQVQDEKNNNPAVTEKKPAAKTAAAPKKK
jgi:DNA anti-recombination protein RmuC